MRAGEITRSMSEKMSIEFKFSVEILKAFCNMALVRIFPCMNMHVYIQPKI